MDRTRWLLGAGTIGAVAFVAVFTLIGAVRVAYDPIRLFVSILSLGEGGIVQILNFVIGGLLIVALGMGLARRWTSGHGGHWIPRLVTVAGFALLGCGIFIPDPSLGYPPGTPDELITPLSWHGAIHYLCATAIGAALSAAVLLSIRRGLTVGNRRVVVLSVATAIAAVGGCVLVLLLVVLSGGDVVQHVGLFERLGIYGGWGWLAGIGILETRSRRA